MSRVILDASAVLALLREEPGSAEVKRFAPRWAISAVNAAEVATRMADEDMPLSEIRATFEDLNLEIIPFDAESAFISASLRPATRHKGLSLGDRACLALGSLSELPVLTADRVWSDLDVGVEIRLIR